MNKTGERTPGSQILPTSIREGEETQWEERETALLKEPELRERREYL